MVNAKLAKNYDLGNSVFILSYLSVTITIGKHLFISAAAERYVPGLF